MACGKGNLKIVYGCMFAEKTTELLRILQIESLIEGCKVLYINHSLDNRSEGSFSTHNSLLKPSGITERIHTLKLSDLRGEMDTLVSYDVIGIDEIQFFGDVCDIILDLVEKHSKRVIIAGLSSNFKRGQDFGVRTSHSFMDLIPFADEVVHCTGVCWPCARKGIHRPSLFTYKNSTKESLSVSSESTNEVGGSDKYQAVCRECYLSLTKRKYGNVFLS